MKKVIYFTSILFVVFIGLQSFTKTENTNSTVEVVNNGCNASDNLETICETFISKCRKGSIRSEFPGQFYKVKIKVVKNGKSKEHKKAWKLLNDKRFKK